MKQVLNIGKEVKIEMETSLKTNIYAIGVLFRQPRCTVELRIDSHTIKRRSLKQLRLSSVTRLN